MELPLLILGLGNEILGDDAAGIMVAKKLKKRLENTPHIHIDTTSLGGLRILDLMKDYKSAILIDTIKSGRKPPGYIHTFSHRDFVSSLRMVSYHEINFSTALEFARKMNITVPEKIIIFAIEAKRIQEFSSRISKEVQRAINECVKKIISLIEREFNLKNILQ